MNGNCLGPEQMARLSVSCSLRASSFRAVSGVTLPCSVCKCLWLVEDRRGSPRPAISSTRSSGLTAAYGQPGCCCRSKPDTNKAILLSQPTIYGTYIISSLPELRTGPSLLAAATCAWPAVPHAVAHEAAWTAHELSKVCSSAAADVLGVLPLFRM